MQGHNRRFKLNFEFDLSKGLDPTRLIISIFHRLIGQYFESRILFISLPYESFIMESQMTRNRQNGEIQIAGFAPTRLIISIFHRLIGQNFESGILFISLANLHGGKR